MLFKLISTFMMGFLLTHTAAADENLLGYNRGVETLPKGSWEVYQILTSRDGKGKGYYHALDSKTEVEYGVSDRFSVIGEIKMQSVNTHGLLIDAYIPKDEKSGLKLSGFEGAMKYNFLSPALDDFGLATYFALSYSWLDPHSGQKKDKITSELNFLFQKYFFEGELVWIGNVGMESTYAKRDEIADLPADFEWPAHPEMEIELTSGTGLSYRFLPGWYFGGELQHQAEFETEVGQERWSLFAGPSLHYGSLRWWTTLTWFSQLVGGKAYSGQTEENLHLVEKTKREIRLKVGLNF